MSKVNIKLTATNSAGKRQYKVDFYYKVPGKYPVHKEMKVPVEEKLSINQLYIHALKLALTRFIKPSEINLYADNNHIVSAINTWLPSWQQDNYINKKGKIVANAELWKEISELIKPHTITAFYNYTTEEEKWPK